MRSARTSRQSAAAIVTGVLVLALAVSFWPRSAGGSTSYLVTRGTSMQPTFSSGDLALLQTAKSYHVGELAAYRDVALHRLVLHRIAALDHGIYTFKGDANGFRDPQPVTRAQIVGRLAVRIPKLGGMLLWLAQPFDAVLLALFVMLAVWSRAQLLALLRGQPPAAALIPVPDEMPEPALRLDQERVVRIRDMSFPHELAVADVVDALELTRLAEHYDRPILLDEAQSALFVVEGSMLFRCLLADAIPGSGLSLVPDAAAEAVTARVVSLVSDDDAAASASTERALPSRPEQDRPSRHQWPARRPKDGRRRPSPHGRDWLYDRVI